MPSCFSLHVFVIAKSLWAALQGEIALNRSVLLSSNKFVVAWSSDKNLVPLTSTWIMQAVLLWSSCFAPYIWAFAEQHEPPEQSTVILYTCDVGFEKGLITLNNSSGFCGLKTNFSSFPKLLLFCVLVCFSVFCCDFYNLLQFCVKYMYNFVSISSICCYIVWEQNAHRSNDKILATVYLNHYTVCTDCTFYVSSHVHFIWW